MGFLRVALRVQAVAFGLYGLAFFLIPDVALDSIFGWETSSFWARAVGVPFLGLAWLEWRVADQLESRFDLIWPFVLIPGLYIVGFVWERAADTYEGTDAFYWVNIVIVVFFFVLVAGAAIYARQEARLTADRETTSPGSA